LNVQTNYDLFRNARHKYLTARYRYYNRSTINSTLDLNRKIKVIHRSINHSLFSLIAPTMSGNLKNDDCSCAKDNGEADESPDRATLPPTSDTCSSKVVTSSLAVPSKPIKSSNNNDYFASYDITSVARLPEETLVDITIDEAFIQQQEAIMRDFAKNNVERMGKASSPPPGRIFKNNLTDKMPPQVTPLPSQDEVVASNMNENLDTNFCDFLNDAEVIREQRRIFGEIQREHEAKASAMTVDDLYTTQNTAPNQIDSLTDQVLETSIRLGPGRMQHFQTSASAIDQASGMPDNSSKTVPSDNAIASSQDRVTRIDNGKKLRIKGTQHAYMSIAKGTAIIVTCPCCQTVLQVDASTKLLFCTRCQHVSELAPSPKNYHDNNACIDDYQIAGSVQQQEIDVACAQRMSKMYGLRGRR
jgi:hypothetical protein